MEIGLIGLGKMGFNLALNMVEKGHRVVAYNRSPEKTKKAETRGIGGAYSLPELVAGLVPPRVIWLMLPAGSPVEEMLSGLVPLLAPGDTIIDGGNSDYRDTLRRARDLQAKGINFVDAGTSGGTEGARRGACLMVGAAEEVFSRLKPLFRDLSVPGGYLHTGPPGSGHFVKMVHNGIEYGMLQAIGEGFEILARGPFPLNLPEIARVWEHGSVIRGWLMELTARALAKDARLEKIKGVVHSSGEGRWAVETALALGVPAPVTAAALFMRYRSEQEESFAGKVVAALRYEFGGHEAEKAGSFDHAQK
ncbi:MAG: phosphogluconate dehydrogenase (NAD(+)-dependent, decarboxylating) [Bacillota bacterium]